MGVDIDKYCVENDDKYHKLMVDNTICEIHRKIYWVLKHKLKEDTHKKELMELTNEAFKMGKKIYNKLLQYNRNLDNEWYQVHKKDGGEIDET